MFSFLRNFGKDPDQSSASTARIVPNPQGNGGWSVRRGDNAYLLDRSQFPGQPWHRKWTFFPEQAIVFEEKTKAVAGLQLRDKDVALLP